MSSVLRDLIEVVEHRFSGSRNVMRTGYGDLDEILGELTPGSLVVVSGPSSVGKSTLVLGIAVHVAGNDGPVLLVTGDTSSATALRYLAAQSGVDGLRLRDGRLRDRDWQTVGRAVERTVSLPFRIVDDLRTIGDVTGVIGAAHHDGPATRLVIIDPVDRYLDQSRRPSDIVAFANDVHPAFRATFNGHGSAFGIA